MDLLKSEYDNLLIGDSEDMDISLFYGKQPGGINERIAIDCLRYILKDILKWDYNVAKYKFDDYIIKRMKLKRLLLFIKYPVEISPDNYDYVLALVYSRKHYLDKTQIIENTYKSVLEKNDAQFPRNYFVGAEGFVRFSICLKYLIEYYHPVNSLEELYNFFTFGKWKVFLLKNRLKVPAETFAINILDVIYNITQNMPHSYFYYSYYSFLHQYKNLGKVRAIDRKISEWQPNETTENFTAPNII